MEDIRVAVHGAMIAACFTEKHDRFHVWLDKDGNPEPILFKNPPLEMRKGDPGCFPTVRLDATNKTNAAKIERLMKAVRDGDLIAKAREEYRVGLEKKRAEERVRASALYRASLAIVIEQMTAKKMEPLTSVAILHNFLTHATDEQIIALGEAMVGAGA